MTATPKPDGPIQWTDSDGRKHTLRSEVWNHMASDSNTAWICGTWSTTPADLLAAGYVPASLATAERLRAEKAEGERDRLRASIERSDRIWYDKLQARDQENADLNSHLKSLNAELGALYRLVDAQRPWVESAQSQLPYDPVDFVAVHEAKRKLDALRSHPSPSDPTAQGRASEDSRDQCNYSSIHHKAARCVKPFGHSDAHTCQQADGSYAHEPVEPAEPEQPAEVKGWVPKVGDRVRVVNKPGNRPFAGLCGYVEGSGARSSEVRFAGNRLGIIWNDSMEPVTPIESIPPVEPVEQLRAELVAALRKVTSSKAAGFCDYSGGAALKDLLEALESPSADEGREG